MQSDIHSEPAEYPGRTYLLQAQQLVVDLTHLVRKIRTLVLALMALAAAVGALILVVF